MALHFGKVQTRESLPMCADTAGKSGCSGLLVTTRSDNPLGVPSVTTPLSADRDRPAALRPTLTSAVPGFCDPGPAGGFPSGLVLAALGAGFRVK